MENYLWLYFTVSYHLYVVFPACAEDKAAAAMLTEPLSGRRDLVEGLDAEAILDYLTQHGVLDADTVQSLRSTDSMTQRNASLLQRVEEEGHNAVALFINALRQSGQLHLASSLDNTQRIKPMSGSGKKHFCMHTVCQQLKYVGIGIVFLEDRCPLYSH